MLRIAIAFVGLFLVGAAIGGVLAIVGRPSTGVPVAVASPNPTALTPSIAPSASTNAASTTLPPATSSTTPTPPPATPEPPTPEPTETPNVTAPPETPSSAPITPAPSTQPVADPAEIPAFMEALGQAISQGTNEFLFTNLHPAVMDRYGEQACRRYTRTTRLQGLSIEYVSANGPEPWDWELDNRTTQIGDAWTVSIMWREPGLEEPRDVHIAPSDATWRWFTDCGDPLA